MPTFLNFSYSNHLVRYSNIPDNSKKNKSCSLISSNSISHINNKTIDDYSVPFKPRPLKHYRKRLITNYPTTSRSISIDTINSPGGITQTNINKDNCNYYKVFNKYKWHNRL